jgi:hypothetical protein
LSSIVTVKPGGFFGRSPGSLLHSSQGMRASPRVQARGEPDPSQVQRSRALNDEQRSSAERGITGRPS